MITKKKVSESLQVAQMAVKIFGIFQEVEAAAVLFYKDFQRKIGLTHHLLMA